MKQLHAGTASAYNMFMIRHVFITVLLAGSFLLLSNLPARGESKHDALTCASCHTGDTGHGGTPLPPPDVCLQCHPDMQGPGHHPVDVEPPAGMDMDAGLSLPDGKVWCSTCHDPHGSEQVAFLRVPADKLCTVCHRK
jgi:predicted CXXCH cytochrome family protein